MAFQKILNIIIINFHAKFMEYEEQKTKEAKLVKDLDKFDMILQAFEYETDQDRAGTLEEFFKSTEGKFTHPKIIKWIEQLYKERDEKLNFQFDVGTMLLYMIHLALHMGHVVLPSKVFLTCKCPRLNLLAMVRSGHFGIEVATANNVFAWYEQSLASLPQLVEERLYSGFGAVLLHLVRAGKP
ncbi:HD domain-containing protein 2 [Portunus trituberculatus]|uniref:HD domain-containing protein 2 n=1 Tax=Portunus trituberculatus TaxID=210409 RepID=A0A5B7GDJ9_PORTR|nr:HD domain-containing protein 2 [Portunus trituberculatus]